MSRSLRSSNFCLDSKTSFWGFDLLDCSYIKNRWYLVGDAVVLSYRSLIYKAYFPDGDITG